MKKRITALIVISMLLAAVSISANTSEIKTKIVIQSIATNGFEKNAPALILYPEGEALKTFEESGAIKKLENSLESMGYILVSKDSDAVVFIRVEFTEHDPFDTEIEFKARSKIDYSNAASTKNYAAIIQGGRYNQLANPQANRARNDPSSILGPSGEIIVLSEQEDNAPKMIEGEEELLKATVYPISFQVSAWAFKQGEGELVPQQLWAVVASYNNLRDEETQPQLLDLCNAASRFFGKNLKKEKTVSR